MGVLLHFHSDERNVGSQEWVAVQGGKVCFKILFKPVFKQKGLSWQRFHCLLRVPQGLEGKKGFLGPKDNSMAGAPNQFQDSKKLG